MGRFVSMDPLGYVDGPNGYQYGMNSPGNYADRMGLAVGDYWDARSYTDRNSLFSRRFWQVSGQFAAGEGKGLALAAPRALAGLFQMAIHPGQTFQTFNALRNPFVAAFMADRMINDYVNSTPFEQGDAFGETVLFGVAFGGFGFTAQGAAVSARVGSAASEGGERSKQGSRCHQKRCRSG